MSKLQNTNSIYSRKEKRTRPLMTVLNTLHNNPEATINAIVLINQFLQMKKQQMEFRLLIPTIVD